MRYLFDTKRYTARYDAWQTYRVLAAPAMIFTGLVSAAMSVATVLVYLTMLRTSPVLGLAVLVGSFAGLPLLLFTFAITYLPYRSSSRHKDDELNVVDASEFSLVGIVGPAARKQTAESLREGLIATFASPAAATMFKRMQADREATIEVVDRLVVPGLTWELLAERAYQLAGALNQPWVTIEHVIAAVLTVPALHTYLRTHDLQTHDVTFVAWWLVEERLRAQEYQRWWDPKTLLAFSGMGLSWTAGFTPLIDRLNHFPRGAWWDQVVIGRKTEVDQLITTLARDRQSNVVVVGHPGAGRLGVVLQMVQRIRQSTAHPALTGQRVVYLHLGEVMAQGASGAGQMSIISAVLREMEYAGNIIAVVDGLGSLLGQGEGRVDMSDILLPFFGSLSVRVVVLMSRDDFHLRLSDNEELRHYFEIIQVKSATPEQTLQILAVAALVLERRTGVYLPYHTLKRIIEDTESILPQVPYPERAFDVLEEALAVAQGTGQRALLPAHIDDLVSRKIGVPLGKVRAEEQQQLLNLEAIMAERLVNQREAISAVSKAMVRARVNVRSQGRPVAVFLFLGPTGVGKTETAKTLAAAYFGGEQHMVRFDMSEFNHPESVGTLLGSIRQPVGRLTAAMSERPFTVLLLDEFEKADPAVHQLFLQVFDEGRLTDARGQEISFKHAIIIATSNAGAELIRTTMNLGPLPANFSQTLRDHILQQQLFRPELLNRFDGVITYTPLTQEHLREVARRMLKKLNSRLDADHGITVAVTPELIDYLLTRGYHPEFGARPMNRAIQDTVEYVVAQKILRGLVTPGEKLTLLVPELEAAVANATPQA